MPFFNTIDEVGNALAESNKKTNRQEDLIYSLFVQ